MTDIMSQILLSQISVADVWNLTMSTVTSIYFRH